MTAWAEPNKAGDVFRARYKIRGGNPVTLDERFAARPGPDRETAKQRAYKKALKAARAAEARALEGDVSTGVGSKVTFATYFEQVWLPAATKELNTVVSYKSTYKVHLKPEFGDMQLRKILPSHVQSFVKKLQKKPGRKGGTLDPGTINKIIAHLQTILAGQKGASALRDGLIQRNPCRGVELPVMTEREVTIYTPDEVDLLLVAMDPWWRPIPVVATDLGLRWGELMGLQVNDFSIGMKAVTIRRTVVEVTLEESPNGTNFVPKAYPKGRRTRTLGLSPEVSEMLIEMVAQRKLKGDDRLFSQPKRVEFKTRKVLTKRPKRTEVWPNGLPVSRGSFRKQVMEKACEASGVPYRRLHDLRASNISWLLDAGMDLPAVMERAGHRHMKTTERYAKAMDADRKAIEALAKVRSLHRRAV